MKRWLVLSSAACLVIAGTTLADVRMGDTELMFSGSLFNQNAGSRSGLDWDSWMVTGGLGYFLTDNVEVGGVGLYRESTEKWNVNESRFLERTANLYAFGGQVKYHFTPENQLVPYIGGQILWADLKVEEDYSATSGNTDWSRDKQGILWGPVAGLRYALNDQNEIVVEYQYHIWAENIKDIIHDGHALMIGLTHKFK